MQRMEPLKPVPDLASNIRVQELTADPCNKFISRLECRTLLAAELSSRGGSTYVAPKWIGDCPLLSVRISALKGEVSKLGVCDVHLYSLLQNKLTIVNDIQLRILSCVNLESLLGRKS